MYDFFYRMNAYSLSMLKIPSVYRYMVTALAGITVSAVWFYGVYQPLTMSLNTFQNYQNNVQNNHDALSYSASGDGVL